MNLAVQLARNVRSEPSNVPGRVAGRNAPRRICFSFPRSSSARSASRQKVVGQYTRIRSSTARNAERRHLGFGSWQSTAFCHSQLPSRALQRSKIPKRTKNGCKTPRPRQFSMQKSRFHIEFYQYCSAHFLLVPKSPCSEYIPHAGESEFLAFSQFADGRSTPNPNRSASLPQECQKVYVASLASLNRLQRGRTQRSTQIAKSISISPLRRSGVPREKSTRG